LTTRRASAGVHTSDKGKATPIILSILTAIFPDGPGLAGTRMSPFWILLELRMMDMVVTTEAIRYAKLQSNCHHQQTNTQHFTGSVLFLSPN